MSQQNYSLQKVAVALLNAALSLEYYMLETYDVYDDEQDKKLDWRNSLADLLDWSLEESYKLRIDVHDLEAWGDELLFQDFKPIAEEVIEKSTLTGGKIAFLVLFLSFVLEKYLNIPAALGKEQTHQLHSQLKEYLQASWQTNLDNEIINPELSNIHMSMARDFSERWQQRVESLTNNAS
jgi:hypothetical protein